MKRCTCGANAEGMIIDGYHDGGILDVSPACEHCGTIADNGYRTEGIIRPCRYLTFDQITTLTNLVQAWKDLLENEDTWEEAERMRREHGLTGEDRELIWYLSSWRHKERARRNSI